MSTIKSGKIFNKIIVNMYNFLIKEKFDYAIILGDRYEALATALPFFLV